MFYPKPKLAKYKLTCPSPSHSDFTVSSTAFDGEICLYSVHTRYFYLGHPKFEIYLSKVD